MLETKKQRIYLNIRNGAIYHKDADGTETKYATITGHVARLYDMAATFNGETVTRHFVDIEDGGQLYTIPFSWASGVWLSLVLCLAGVDDLNPLTVVSVTPYVKNGFQRVTVTADGKKCEWYKCELPPVVYTVVNGQRVGDKSARIDFINSLAHGVSEKLYFENNKQ